MYTCMITCHPDVYEIVLLHLWPFCLSLLPVQFIYSQRLYETETGGNGSCQPLMPGLHSRLGYLLRLLARCERDKIRTNVDIHTLVHESSITRQDIRDILVSFDSGLIYQHVFESFEMRTDRECGRWDECTLHILILVLSRAISTRM